MSEAIHAKVHSKMASYESIDKKLPENDKGSSFWECLKFIFCCGCCKKSKTYKKVPVSDVTDSEPITTQPKSQDFYLVENDQLKEDKKRLKERIKDLEQKLTNKDKEVQKETENLKQQLESKEKEAQQERDGKEKALSRLSAIAGSKLRNKNPGIVDLSDENRPSKIAEQFSELYDNEWTDVIEAEINVNNRNEEEAIEVLFNLLKCVFVKCKSLTEEQRGQLEAAIIFSRKSVSDDSTDMDDHVQMKLKDFQKETSSFVIDKVIEMLHSGELKSEYEFEFEQDPKYVNKCIKLCWLMNIQDPPLHLNFNDEKGQTFDKDYFRHYTATGKVIKFVVWPALLLHMDGPLLSKGVAQPMGADEVE